jgi:hypothetical protein
MASVISILECDVDTKQLFPLRQIIKCKTPLIKCFDDQKEICNQKMFIIPRQQSCKEI